jgi:glucose/arabinose dehydrogenase
MDRRLSGAARANAFVAAAAVCTATGASAQMRARLIAQGFESPVAFVQDPADPAVQVVVEQGGLVRVLKGGTVLAASFLDLRAATTGSGERGLLGLAFAPDYAASGRVYVCFTNREGNSVVARFTRSATSPVQLDPDSRFDFGGPDGRRFIEQPFANHNGGNLAFGSDGYLYVGLGDGGSGDDPMHNAQNPQLLLGKMLRLDVSVPASDPAGYRVPPSNPFAGRADVLHEIWDFGVRNPWRWSFDDPRRGGTGALVIADVGQNEWEEIDCEPAGRGGRNYGWRNREAAHPHVTDRPPFSTPLVDPVFEYSHAAGQSITGGFVYRGTALGAAMVGRYVFADFGSGRLWSIGLRIDPATGEAAAFDLLEHTASLGIGRESWSSFGVDGAGELYAVAYSGRIYRLEDPTAPPSSNPQPASPGGRPRPPDTPAKGRASPR